MSLQHHSRALRYFAGLDVDKKSMATRAPAFASLQILEYSHDSLNVFRKWDSDVPKLKRQVPAGASQSRHFLRWSHCASYQTRLANRTKRRKFGTKGKQRANFLSLPRGLARPLIL